MPKHGETTPENHRLTCKTTGCMTGILHLFSRHHHRHHRKRLSAAASSSPYNGKKKEKAAATSPPPKSPASPPTPPPSEVAGEITTPIPQALTPLKSVTAEGLRRRSCDALRSPSLPPEIRRCSSAGSPRRQPAVIVRLMGLDKASGEEYEEERSPETAAEKRRRLLGALERCDEDLKALKRIIDAVRLEDARKSETEAVGSVGYIPDPMPDAARGGVVKDRAEQNGFESLDGEDWTVVEKKNKCTEINVEQPSPVSVLDTITSPNNKSEKGQDQDHSPSVFHRIAVEGLQRVPHANAGDFMERFESAVMRQRENGRQRQRRWTARSAAMVENVEEVWKDGLWEERWELGRVGVHLEGDILADLMEEVVWELMGCCYSKLLFPLGMRRRRLCF